jgi:hypothetical protein
MTSLTLESVANASLIARYARANGRERVNTRLRPPRRAGACDRWVQLRPTGG